MAAATRRPAASLEDDLLCRGHEFSFFQAMRLLAMLAKEDVTGERRVRVHPELSLSFPASDVAGIDRIERGYRVRVTFLGLYGQASPLPTFYTEQLHDESGRELSVTKDFLDLINHRFYLLLYQCVMKYRLFGGASGCDADRSAGLLRCLMGLGGSNLCNDLPIPSALLPYAGLLALNSRSAAGLMTLLGDALKVPVKVVQCVRQLLPVPAGQQLRLGLSGCRLDVDAVLGREVAGSSEKFRIVLGPLDRPTFSTFLPGEPKRRLLDALVGFYLKVPLSWEVELLCAAGEIPATMLGVGTGCRLGSASWLSPDAGMGDASALFPGPTGASI